MCEYEVIWVSYDHFRDFVLSMGFPIYPLPLSDKTAVNCVLGMHMTLNLQKNMENLVLETKPSARFNFLSSHVFR